MTRTVFAPAKLNLFLRVTGKRADGYHTLNTLISFTDLGDTLSLQPADSYTLSVDGPFAHHAPAGDDNLVTRAVRAMEKATGQRAHIDVRLTKSIPAGAGLGGGSADAAAIMRALNDLWHQPLSLSEMQVIGLSIGAELPACLAGGAQWVEGIGDVLAPIDVPPKHAVVIWPHVTLSTADVFNHYKGKFSKHMAANVTDTGNDLTDAAVYLAPAIGEALRILPGARMTGSGSAVFSVCDDAQIAKETAAKLAAACPDWWVRSCKIS